MFKNLYHVICVATIAALVLTACGPSNPEPCNSVVYRVEVNVPVGTHQETITQSVFSVPAHGTNTADYWLVDEKDVQAVDAWFQTIREDVTKVNRDLDTLLGRNDFFAAVGFNLYEGYSPNLRSSFYGNCRGSEGVYERVISLNFTTNDLNGYALHVAAGEGRTFVSYETPSGSKLSYSFGSWRINNIIKGNFEHNPEMIADALDLTYEIAVQDVAPGGPAYQNILLESMLATRDTGQEVASIKLLQDDYSGRELVRGLLNHALELAAADYKKPVQAVLFGHMVDGTVAVGNVNFQQHAATVSGWWILGSGVLNGTGGGEEFTASYSATTTDIIMGSVFMKEVEK
ncbi:hypothetical protein HY411_02750 [Candidatus Gottesmanbacteria bacterium]|nr:hypothetical protein [Candidatus Gottesmanbacteria bacterium]